MPSFCVVSDCELKYSHSENVSFHKFPLNNPTILKKWIEFTDRGPNWKPSRWSSICSRHFASSDFKDFLSRKCLKKSAVPSVMTKRNNINIDYHTYHLNLNTNATDGDGCLYYGGTSHTIEDIHEQDSPKEPVTCCLCGDPQDESAEANGLASADDIFIAPMIKKCFPATTLRPEGKAQRVICAECTQLLKLFNEFVDKVMAYQKELLAKGSNMNVSYCSSEISCDGQRPSVGIASKDLGCNTIFIKQEPINVKQETQDTSNKRSTIQSDAVFNPFAKHQQAVLWTRSTPIISSNHSNSNLINVVEQKIHYPRSGHSFCGFCDRIFVNNLELETHTCNSSRRPQRELSSLNNCEIMEIITLNNSVSFIDLAEEEYMPLNRMLKVEHLSDFEKKERVDTDHAYAKRPEILLNQKNLKQEINYDSSDTSESNVEVYEPSTDKVYVDLSHNNSGHDSDDIREFGNRLAHESEPIVCQPCSQRFDSQQSLQDHMASFHSLKTKTCTLCSVDFKSVHDYLVHKNKMHAVGHQCGQCRRVFAFKHALNNHQRYSCSAEVGDSYYSCKYCGKRFRNRMRMNDHVKQCSISKLEEDSKRDDRTIDDRCVLHRKSKCNACEGGHLKGHSDSEEVVTLQLKSDLREEFTKNFITLESPYDFKKQIEEAIIEIPSGPIDNNLDTQSCSPAQNPPAPIFDNPKPIHSGDNQIIQSGKFVCETCGKAFQTFPNLKQHKFTHIDEKKFNCSMCPKTFKRLSGLNQHIRGFHYKIKPYCCTVCKHTYALKGDMLRCRHSSMKNK